MNASRSAGLRSNIAAAQDKKRGKAGAPAPEFKFTDTTEAADTLAKIGLFVGGQTSPQQASAQRQVQLLEWLVEQAKRQTAAAETTATALTEETGDA